MIGSLIKHIIPFLKEITVGDEEVTAHLRKNKFTTFLILANVAWFVIFLFITEQNLKTQRDLAIHRGEETLLTSELKVCNEKLTTLPPLPVTDVHPKSPVTRPKPIPHEPKSPTRSKLDAIRKEEEVL